MSHKMIRIPNEFVNLFPKPTELKVACAFYSLININTESDVLGNYRLSVSQKTLAKLCGCSIITINRTVSKLMKKGFIMSQTRPVTNRKALNGAYMLDKYTYTIRSYYQNSSYFCLDKSILRRIKGQTFKVYVFFCKLADSLTRTFFHSLKDLSCDTTLKTWFISRKEIGKAVRELVSRKLIRKIKKRTPFGDYTENTYVIHTRPAETAVVKTNSIQQKSDSALIPTGVTRGHYKSHNTVPAQCFKHTCIVLHFGDFVKSFFKNSAKKVKSFLGGVVEKVIGHT